MPNALSIASILEKNRIDSDVPFLMLLDIEVVNPSTGMIDETIHVVRNNEDIVVAGQTYVAAMFDIEFSYESGGQPNINASVNDYTGALQARLEAYNGGIGFNITMSIVDGSNLANPPEIAETFTVLSASVQDYVISFQLGAENEVMMAFPRRRQDRDFCAWRYKSPQCSYGITSLPYLANSAASSGYLSRSVTPPAFGSAITFSCYVVFHRSRDVRLSIHNVTTNTARSALFTLNDNGTVTITGDGATGSYSVFIKDVDVVSPNLPSYPVCYRISVTLTIPAGESANTFQARIFPSVTNTVAKAGAYLGAPQVEAGSVATAYEETTVAAGTRNKLVQSASLQSAPWAKSGVEFYPTEYGYSFGPNIGPLETCDLTLQGPNGCAAHNNTGNFGGFPGLNANAYRYG